MNLLELAARCEAADAGEQRTLLMEAWDALNPEPQERARWDKVLYRFVVLHAKAYESAALMLVPEGWTRLLDNTDGKEIAELYPHGPVDDERIARGSHPISLALALCAAALRARASDTAPSCGT